MFPAMLPIKQLLSTFTPNTFKPIQITLLAVVGAPPAPTPKAVLPKPLVLPSALTPMAVLLKPIVLAKSEKLPLAVLLPPWCCSKAL